MESKVSQNLYKDINKFTLYFKKYINNYLKNNTNYCYSKKSNLKDALLFNLLKTQKNTTQQSITSKISLLNKQKISRQGMMKRVDSISTQNLEYLYKNLLKDFNKNNFKSDMSFVDGTKINVYSNKDDKGYKTLNLLGIINNNGIADGVYKNKDENKSEIALFYEYLEKNLFDSSKTLVLDRLYFSTKLVEKCTNKNINFIARIKGNSHFLTKYNILKNSKTVNNENLNDYEVSLSSNPDIKIRPRFIYFLLLKSI